MIKITLPGNPEAQKRHRFSNRGGFGRMYDPQSSIKQKLQLDIMPQIENLAPNLPTVELLHVDMDFHVEIPRSFNRTQKNASLWNWVRPTNRDIDNLCKFILDLSNGLLWKDDRQIYSLTAKKQYSEIPRTEITIMPLKSLKNEETLKQFNPAQMQEFLFDCDMLANYMALSNDQMDELGRLISVFSKKWQIQLSRIAHAKTKNLIPFDECFTGDKEWENT